MSAVTLPFEAWFVIAVIAGVMVLTCLATVAKILHYERGLQELLKEVREVRARRGELRETPRWPGPGTKSAVFFETPRRAA